MLHTVLLFLAMFVPSVALTWWYTSRRRGTWLDHQCRRPSVEGWSGWRTPGDRWECRCGRVWVIRRGADGFGRSRVWTEEVEK